MRSFSFSPSSLRISRAIVVCPLLVSVDCDIAPYYPNFSLPAIKIKAEGRRCSQSRPSVHLSAESESVNSGKHPWEQEQTDGITHITTEAITPLLLIPLPRALLPVSQWRTLLSAPEWVVGVNGRAGYYRYW